MDIVNFMVAIYGATAKIDDKEVVFRVGRPGGKEYTEFVFVSHADKIVIEGYTKEEWRP